MLDKLFHIVTVLMLKTHVSQADIDKDGRLSLAEMLEHPYVFYSSVFSDEDEYDYDYHDELR